MVVKNVKDDQKMLPVSMAKDNIKCLDFDMDKVVFTSTPRSSVKMAVVNPYNKTLLEVMDMV
jgi:hypothetical protein